MNLDARQEDMMQAEEKRRRREGRADEKMPDVPHPTLGRGEWDAPAFSLSLHFHRHYIGSGGGKSELPSNVDLQNQREKKTCPTPLNPQHPAPELGNVSMQKQQKCSKKSRQRFMLIFTAAQSNSWARAKRSKEKEEKALPSTL
jgi:hypothetical protein